MLAVRRAGFRLSTLKSPWWSFRWLRKTDVGERWLEQNRKLSPSRNYSAKATGTDTSASTHVPHRKRKEKNVSPPLNAAFFKVDGATPPSHTPPSQGEESSGGWVVGEVTDHAIDLHDVRPVSVNSEKRRRKRGLSGREDVVSSVIVNFILTWAPTP